MIKRTKAFLNNVFTVFSDENELNSERNFIIALVLVFIHSIFISSFIAYQLTFGQTNVLQSTEQDISVFLITTLQTSFLYIISWAIFIILAFAITRLVTKNTLVTPKKAAIIFGRVSLIIIIFQTITYLALKINMALITVPLSALIYIFPFIILYRFATQFTEKDKTVSLSTISIIILSAISFEILGANPFIPITHLSESGIFEIINNILKEA